MTWQRFFAALGRGIAAVARVLWQAFVAIVTALWAHVAVPILQGLGHALGALVRRLAPWAIGGLALLYLVQYQPEMANQLLTIAVFCGVVYAAFRLMRKPAKKKKKT